METVLAAVSRGVQLGRQARILCSNSIFSVQMLKSRVLQIPSTISLNENTKVYEMSKNVYFNFFYCNRPNLGGICLKFF